MSVVQVPRKERVEYGGALYYVMGRGNRLEAIFCDDRDREVFLKTLGEASERCGWRVHCYVLMGNHYHLLLETPEASEEGMLKALRRGWCFGSEEFRAALVEKMGKKDGSVHTNNGSAIKRTHDEQEAERLIAIGLKALGISAVDLPKQPKGSAEKIALASVARQRTSVTNAWLAERLSMGAANRVSRYCGEAAGRSDIQKFA
jgi:hypothetical protein